MLLLNCFGLPVFFVFIFCVYMDCIIFIAHPNLFYAH